MTAPDESQMAHCRDCAHRLGSGCGCECCPWAGEAVAEAAQAIGAYRDWAGTAGPTDEALAREAVQAALPVVRAAAAAEERAKAAAAKAVEMAVAAERERCAAWLESIAPAYALGTTALAHAAQRLRAPGA